MSRPPQDIPFWPDYMRRELAPEHHKTWCIAPRLTDSLRSRGYTLAITPKASEKMQAAHAAEVRAAVIARLGAVAPPETVAAILADPAIQIVTEHHLRVR